MPDALPKSSMQTPPQSDLSAEKFAACLYQAWPTALPRRLALAVSGGGDSMALLYLAAEWATKARQNHSNHELVVLTVDHGLRADAYMECCYVAKQAERVGCSARILRLDSPFSLRGGLQSAARQLRYQLLERTCLKMGIFMLLTAHHLEDRAETFLLRLERRSGVDGLAVLPDCMGGGDLRLVRPFLSLHRAELRAYLRAHGHFWFDDPANQDERFARTRIRACLPILNRFGLTAKILAKDADRMIQQRRRWAGAASALLEKKDGVYSQGWAFLSHATIARAQYEHLTRIVSFLLRAIGGNIYAPRRAKLDKLYEALQARQNFCRSLCSCLIEKQSQGIYFYREYARISSPCSVVPGEKLLWDQRFNIHIGNIFASSLRLQALGGKGWAQYRDGHKKKKPGFAVSLADMPDRARLCLPSLWRGEELLAVGATGQKGEKTPIGAVFRDPAQSMFFHPADFKLAQALTKMLSSHRNCH